MVNPPRKYVQFDTTNIKKYRSYKIQLLPLSVTPMATTVHDLGISIDVWVGYFNCNPIQRTKLTV